MPTLIATVSLQDYADLPIEQLVATMKAREGVQVDVLDYFDDSAIPKRLSLTMRVDDGYGDHTRATWEGFWGHVQQKWSYEGGRHLRRDTTYHLIDADGRRWGQIRRAREGGSPRDYLGSDERLSCGTGLELLMADGHWARCRYEVGHEDGDVISVIYLHLFGTAAIVQINDAMVFRTIDRGGRR